MSDIVKAIAKEQEYLAFREKNEEPFHLIDAVKEFGFNSLAEYFDAKRSYEFNNLSFEVIENTPAKVIEDVLRTIQERKTAILFANTEYTLVWNGDNSTFNETYCAECDIPIYPLYTEGGTIVSTVGDLNIGISVPQNLNVDAQFILNKFADIFRKYTDKLVQVSGNDVLVDGFKVLGSSTYSSNNMFMFITPVSMSDKYDLIEHICQKHSTKQPGYINFMNADELREEVLKWLLQN